MSVAEAVIGFQQYCIQTWRNLKMYSMRHLIDYEKAICQLEMWRLYKENLSSTYRADAFACQRLTSQNDTEIDMPI